MIFRKDKISLTNDEAREILANLEAWRALVVECQQNMLSMTYLFLAVVEDPDLLDEVEEDEIRSLINAIEDGLAQMKEHVL